MIIPKKELLNSIIYIQYVFRKFFKFVKEINSTIKFLYECIHYMMDDLIYNFKNNSISYSKYNNDMLLVEVFLKELNDLPKPFCFKLFNMKVSISERLKNIRLDIFHFVSRSGTLSIKYILLLLFDENYRSNKNTNKKIYNYIKFYNKSFKVLSLNIYDLNICSKEYKSNCLHINFKKINENDNKVLKKYRRDIEIFNENKKDTPFCIDIKGDNASCRFYLYIYDHLLVMNGYFQEDPLNISRIDSIFKNKNSSILYLLKKINIEENFKNAYYEQLSLRDFIICEPSEIIKRCSKAYSYLVELKSKTIHTLLKEFFILDIEKQTYMLSILLLSSNETQYVAYIIYDMISNDVNLLKPQPLSEQLFNKLHWSIQKLFKIAIKKIDTYKYNLDNFDSETLSYDKRIFLLKADDNVKKKAMEKYSEISNNSSEHTHKPIQYLEGLLKIPFGVYKREPIISFLYNFGLEVIHFNSDVLECIKNSSQENNIVLTTCNDMNNSVKKSKHIIDTYIKTISENMHSIYSIDIHNKDLTAIDYKNICKKYDIKCVNNKTDMIACIDTILKTNQSQLSQIKRNIDIYNYIKSIINDKNILKNKSGSSIVMLSYINSDDFIKIYSAFNDLSIKWQKYKTDKIHYLNNVDTILNRSVYGHSEAKLQIKRIIAQWINGENSGYCFGFEGPPGNGKTTLAKYGLSKCLIDEDGSTRPFGFIPIGGNSNGSTLEGHSYTYVGSTWGRIVDILIESKCMNPIIFVDELDKISRTENGRELIGILTHLTDSTQNSEFYDKYFSGIKLDLSRALFIFSYNDPELIDPILRDRITRVRTKCFNKHDKCIICRDYLLPEILKVVGYNVGDITIDDEDIVFIIKNYTAEAGVRKLKEKLFELVRQINLDIIMGNSMIFPIKITREFIENVFSDRPKIEVKKILPISYIGIINGLYASQNGLGGITVIESFKTPSDVKLSLEITGQQGDVMKESIKCAKTLAWNLLPSPIKNKINKEWSDNGIYGIHVHCPEGSTPKDGPSAGTAITISILSLLIGVPICNTIAITGEIDLNGKVLAVGGLEHKVEGAKLAGITDVYCPLDNRDDIEKIRRSQFPPEDEGFKITYIDTIYDVLEKVFDYNNNYNGIEKVVFNRLL